MRVFENIAAVKFQAKKESQHRVQQRPLAHLQQGNKENQDENRYQRELLAFADCIEDHPLESIMTMSVL